MKCSLKRKKNVLYVPEGQYDGLGLIPLLLGSDALILDISSILVDALLTNKPILFAQGGNLIQSWIGSWSYRPIQELYQESVKLTIKNAKEINPLIRESLKQDRSNVSLERVKKSLFYNLDGKATQGIVRFANSKLASLG